MEEEKVIGRVIIASEPISADVYLNGIYYGVTALDLHLPVGTYTCKIEKVGYKTRVLPIDVEVGFPPPEYLVDLEEQ